MNNPRCKDGTLDMRFACNRGLDKYGGSSGSGGCGSSSQGFGGFSSSNVSYSRPAFNNYIDNDSTRNSSYQSSVNSSSSRLTKNG